MMPRVVALTWVIEPRGRSRLAAALLLGLAAACSDGPVAPQRGTVRILSQTSGGDLDLDGYMVVLDGNTRRVILANGSATINDIMPGAHLASLEMVADNCTVRGDNQRSLNVTAGQSVDVTFEVVCDPTGIAVTVHTTGSDVPTSYQVAVNGGPSVVLEPNGSAVVSRLQAGTYTVALSIPFDNCTVEGGKFKTVEISARAVAPVAFDITCVPLTRSKKIAYVVDTIVNFARETWIETVNVDGSHAVRLALGSSPSWSPEGLRLAYTDAHCVYYYYYAYFGCSGAVVTIDPETGYLFGVTDGSQGFSPAWSPTGDAIAVVRCCDLLGAPGRLFLLGLRALPTRELVVPGVLGIRHPVWSPDGQQLAFVCLVDDDNTDLCTINKNGGGFTRLTRDPFSKADPAWSPDGKLIAFTRGAAIALIALADGRVTLLTDGREPSWSPDGSKLLFATDNGLFTIDADGLALAQLTTGKGQHAPVWRP
jgi:hypothetical protein